VQNHAAFTGEFVSVGADGKVKWSAPGRRAIRRLTYRLPAHAASQRFCAKGRVEYLIGVAYRAVENVTYGL
jgi:hypothetical protein